MNIEEDLRQLSGIKVDGAPTSKKGSKMIGLSDEEFVEFSRRIKQEAIEEAKNARRA